MRKILGTITIVLIIYLGFFGSDRFNIEPFILNWIKSWDTKEVKHKAERCVDVITE